MMYLQKVKLLSKPLKQLTARFETHVWRGKIFFGVPVFVWVSY